VQTEAEHRRVLEASATFAQQLDSLTSAVKASKGCVGDQEGNEERLEDLQLEEGLEEPLSEVRLQKHVRLQKNCHRATLGRVVLEKEEEAVAQKVSVLGKKPVVARTTEEEQIKEEGLRICWRYTLSEEEEMEE